MNKIKYIFKVVNSCKNYEHLDTIVNWIEDLKKKNLLENNDIHKIFNKVREAEASLILGGLIDSVS